MCVQVIRAMAPPHLKLSRVSIQARFSRSCGIWYLAVGTVLVIQANAAGIFVGMHGMHRLRTGSISRHVSVSKVCVDSSVAYYCNSFRAVSTNEYRIAGLSRLGSYFEMMTQG
jgi:hypothetical protein